MSIQIQDPPCIVEEVFNFNVENLHKLLNFLINSDSEVINKLNEFQGKIIEMDEFKLQVLSFQEKVYTLEDKTKEIHRHLLSTIDVFNHQHDNLEYKVGKNFEVNNRINNNKKN